MDLNEAMTRILMDYPEGWFEIDMDDGLIQLVFVVSTLGPHIAGYGVDLDAAYDDFAEEMNGYESPKPVDLIQSSERWSEPPF